MFNYLCSIYVIKMLIILERAYVTSLSDDATVQYGTDIELSCKFAGTPVPAINWLFNGRAVDLGKYRVDGQMLNLNVKDFQPSNVGVYQCLVSNQYGADIRSVTLYGKGELVACKYF